MWPLTTCYKKFRQKECQVAVALVCLEAVYQVWGGPWLSVVSLIALFLNHAVLLIAS